MNSQLASTVQVSVLPEGGLLATRGGWTGFIFGLVRRDTRLSTDVDVLGEDAVKKFVRTSIN